MERTIRLNGTWEKGGKSPLFASFILVFITGGLYSFIPSIIANLYVGIDAALGGFTFSFDDFNFIDIYSAFYRRYKYFILILTFFFQFGLFLTVPLLIMRKWHTTDIGAYIQSDHLHLPAILLSLLGVFFVIPIVDATSRFFYFLFPVFERLSEIARPLYKIESIPELIVTLTGLSLTPAICEEFLFRGYFQRTLQRKLSFPWHCLVSGLVFALFHQNPLGLPALFLVGFFLGFIYYCSGSIYTSMAVHFLYNVLIILSVDSSNLPTFLVAENGFYRLPILVASVPLFILVSIGIYLVRSKEITDSFVQVLGEQEKDKEKTIETKEENRL
ncbi:MAG: CPBP family intramembrane metalloprotease [Spirochaetales bacterium]|nr:CPBP family intramembrane metalloprotease [Spirochaetales bacterium]